MMTDIEIEKLADALMRRFEKGIVADLRDAFEGLGDAMIERINQFWESKMDKEAILLAIAEAVAPHNMEPQDAKAWLRDLATKIEEQIAALDQPPEDTTGQA